jgi:hypothetical protein
VTTVDTSQEVHVENLGVSFAFGNLVLRGVLFSLDVDGSGRASTLAKETTYAAFQSVFVTVENMPASDPFGNLPLFLWILLGNRFFEGVSKCNTETFSQGHQIVYDSIHNFFSIIPFR